MQLTNHFTSEEFSCPCCGRDGIDRRLVDILEQIRASIDVPIIILSGVRCPRHNGLVGGSPHSQHLLGKAADIYIRGYSVKDLYDLASQFFPTHFTGLGIYPEQRFIHVDIREGTSASWVYLKSINKYISMKSFEELLKADEKLRSRYEQK